MLGPLHWHLGSLFVSDMLLAITHMHMIEVSLSPAILHCTSTLLKLGLLPWLLCADGSRASDDCVYPSSLARMADDAAD